MATKKATDDAKVETVESAVQAPDGTTVAASASEPAEAPVPAPDALADLRAFIQNEHDTHVPAMLAYRNAEIWCGRNGVEFKGNGRALLQEIYDGVVNDSMSEFTPNAKPVAP